MSNDAKTCDGCTSASDWYCLKCWNGIVRELEVCDTERMAALMREKRLQQRVADLEQQLAARRSRPATRLWLDTETTGLDAQQHELLEVAVVVESVAPDGSGEIMHRWSRRIAPERIETASPKALEVNGYTAEAWQDAPRFEDVADHLAEVLLSGTVICGHNVGFDVAFIEAAFARVGRKVRVPYHRVDTVTLAYAAWMSTGSGPGLSLDKLRAHLGIEADGSHSALKDALDARTVYYAAIAALRGAP